MSKTAIKGERCGRCQSLVNEGSVVCSKCGALRRFASTGWLRELIVVLGLVGICSIAADLTIDMPYGMIAGVSLLVLAILLYKNAPKRVYYIDREDESP